MSGRSISLGAALLLIIACGETPTEPGTDALGVSTSAAALRAKVDVCHRRGNGTWILINVAEAALPAHLAHGDGQPGDPVPGKEGFVFDENCEVIFVLGLGTPTIDGVFGDLEWDRAITFMFNADLPGVETGTTPATVYVLNDATNLYMALRFSRTVVDPGNSMAIEFDVDGNGFLSDGDDGVIINPTVGFRDLIRRVIATPPCNGGLCGVRDTDLGGTLDGAGAFANDGSFTLYELSHPLNSGDTQDFALAPNDVIGFRLSLRMIDGPYPDGFGDTDFPISGFQDITIVLPPTP